MYAYLHVWSYRFRFCVLNALAMSMPAYTHIHKKRIHMQVFVCLPACHIRMRTKVNHRTYRSLQLRGGVSLVAGVLSLQPMRTNCSTFSGTVVMIFFRVRPAHLPLPAKHFSVHLAFKLLRRLFNLASPAVRLFGCGSTKRLYFILSWKWWVFTLFAPPSSLHIHMLHFMFVHIYLCMYKYVWLGGGILSLVSHSPRSRCHEVYMPLINLLFYIMKCAYTLYAINLRYSLYWYKNR